MKNHKQYAYMYILLMLAFLTACLIEGESPNVILAGGIAMTMCYVFMMYIYSQTNG